jgi:predicted transcriptional regulator
MDILYARDETTAAEVVELMADPPSKTAVRTMLRILEDKGFLKHRKQGRQFVYKPTQPRKRAGQSALRRVLATFFDGSLEDAVAAHCADPQSNLTDAELNQLVRFIRQSRGKEQ